VWALGPTVPFAEGVHGVVLGMAVIHVVWDQLAATPRVAVLEPVEDGCTPMRKTVHRREAATTLQLVRQAVILANRYVRVLEDRCVLDRRVTWISMKSGPICA
jgi:hypothetical protein